MEAVLIALGALVALLVFGAIVLSGRKGIFWLAFLATLVPLDFVDRYYLDLPSSVKWLPDAAFVVAGAAALVLVPAARTPFPRGLVLVYAAIAAEALLSMVFNRSSPTALAVSQRGYVLLFAALLALRAVRGIYDKDRLYGVLVSAGVVSAVVSIVQRGTIAASEPDRVTGLFSLGEVVLFYHLVCIGIVLAYWLEGRRVGGWNTGLALGLLVTSLAIGNQEAALPYFVILLGWLFVRARARRGPLLALGIALPAAMLALFTLVYDSSYESREGSYSRAIFEPAYVKRYLFGEREDVLTPGGDLLRGAAIVTAYREVSGDVPGLLLGQGPGATAGSGLGGTGVLAQTYPGIGRVTLSMLLGDTGLLGVALYVVLLAGVVARRPAPALGEPHEQRLVRELVVLLALSYFIYMRMAYEPCYAWILATVLEPGAARVRAPDGAGEGLAPARAQETTLRSRG